MNINELFDKFTNFQIKHTENPTPIEVSNMSIRFLIGENEYNNIDDIRIDSLTDKLIVRIK